jgi:hypothetical protein
MKGYLLMTYLVLSMDWEAKAGMVLAPHFQEAK